jgi:hypothetical protein
MRKLTFAVLLVLSLPAAVFAGGPPWLCLPIDGVTEKTAPACAELLSTKLQDKLWKDGGELSVKVVAYEGQWYATFSMGTEVTLGEVEAALKGSKLSVAKGNLRLFGHVILEIDPQQAMAKDLVAKLDEINEVSIEATSSKEGKLLVTIDMPYPVHDSGKERGAIGWTTFQRDDLSSDASDRSPKTAEDLPTYANLQKVVSKSGGSLKDIRWSDNFRCRMLGGVVARPSDAGKK